MTNPAQSSITEDYFSLDSTLAQLSNLTSAARAQYCATIGQLEPSFVIRKFLDAQRIHNLTSYLEALHDRVQHAAETSP